MTDKIRENINIRYKGYTGKEPQTFDDFFTAVVMGTERTWNVKNGIERQAEMLASLLGSIMESLVIRGVFNVDDVDRVLGSYFMGVEIIEGEEE